MLFWIGIILMVVGFGLVTEIRHKVDDIKDYYDLPEDSPLELIWYYNEFTKMNKVCLVSGCFGYISGFVCIILWGILAIIGIF